MDRIDTLGIEARQATEELHRLYQQQLEEDVSRFHNIIEQTRDGICLVDEQGLIIAWNPAIARMTGLLEGDVLCKPIWEINFQLMPEEQRDPEGIEGLKSGMLDLLKTGRGPWSDRLIEQEYVRPDGSRTFIEGWIYAVKTEKGFLLVSVSQDINERKRMEQVLLASVEATAVLEERNRLACELHDSVAQTLYSISLYGDATRRALSANKLDVVDKHLAELQRLTSEAVANMRQLIYELRPPVLDEVSHEQGV